MGSDVRIGSRFLRAGPAYGGSCFPKDTKGLVSFADKVKINLSIVKSVIKSNHNRRYLLLKRIDHIFKKNIKHKKIVFLGVTFKPNTDDMRDAVSLYMIPHLHRRKAIISYYDPTGEKKEFSKLKNCNFYSNIKDACKNADLIILHTEWDEFKSLDFNKLINNKKFILYDLRNLYSVAQMRKKNINYFSIGRSTIN
jgi:UDPglucose 6-dehydrogenase